MSPPMDEVDQAVLLNALSASAIALFEAHFRGDSPNGAPMLALLKALDAQAQECTSVICEWAIDLPRLRRQLEKARETPVQREDARKADLANTLAAYDAATAASERERKRNA